MNKFSNGNKIILASASPRRRQLLQQANIDFEVIPSNTDEVSGLPPQQLVATNACLKAENIAKKYKNRIVLGSDTIVALGDKIFGKPNNVQEASQMLMTLQGKKHSVYTSVCIAKFDGSKIYKMCNTQKSDVKFKNLTSDDIQQYLKCVNVLDKAGAYAVQECGDMIIEKIDGDFDNVMGLPIQLVKNMLDTVDF